MKKMQSSISKQPKPNLQCKGSFYSLKFTLHVCSTNAKRVFLQRLKTVLMYRDLQKIRFLFSESVLCQVFINAKGSKMNHLDHQFYIDNIHFYKREWVFKHQFYSASYCKPNLYSKDSSPFYEKVVLKTSL